jgi:hypothetical protein
MLLGPPPAPPSRQQTKEYKTTTIRQFDGGWNVVDNELTLAPRFARIFDNVVRGSDGSVSVRPGYKLFKDLKTGTVDSVVGAPVSISTTNNDRRVVIGIVGHPFANDQHITIHGVGSSVNGIPAEELNTTHVVRVIDANSFDIVVQSLATSTAAIPVTISYDQDTNLIGGDVVNGTFFQDCLILVTSVGEVVQIDSTGTASVIWNNAFAYAQAGNPPSWGATDFVSFNQFGGKLLAHNGRDKPLEIDTHGSPKVVFLGDPASGGSNAFVPIGQYGYTSNKFAIIAGIEDDPSLVQFSASSASGVWTGNPDPADAADVDLSKVTGAVDPEITGLTELRDKLLVCFRDSISIGTLGETKTIGTETIHDPQFKDNVAQHGAVSHRSIVPLGGDVFMCDRVGVPSLAQSQLSNLYIPARVSDLIEPALQANINRLSDTTLAKKVFAVWNSQDRQYMLFMPKFDDEDVRAVEGDGLFFSEDLEDGEFIVRLFNHGLEADDPVIVAGAIDVGSNLAASINGTWSVSAVINDNYFVVSTSSTFDTSVLNGGGENITVQPLNQETLGYIYSYNPALKVRAWSRYRGMNFDWGTKTPGGFVYFGKGGKVYRLGSKLEPYYSDQLGDYDDAGWVRNTDYPVGRRVLDDGVVYTVLVAHTSGNASLQDDRTTHIDWWEVDTGLAIKFAWEWPWGDFDKRLKVKQVGAIFPDAYGSAEFTISIFVDQIYRSGVGKLSPVRAMTFTGSDSGGYGSGFHPFGAGRRVREQLVWPVPLISKLIKLRITGAVKEALRVVAVSITYREGSMGR